MRHLTIVFVLASMTLACGEEEDDFAEVPVVEEETPSAKWTPFCERGEEITGNVTVSSIDDVNGLEGVSVIWGDLQLLSVDVVSLEAMRCLQIVGGDLEVRSSNVPGATLDNLERVDGDVVIANNPTMAAVPTFIKLTTVGGSVIIQENHTLTDLSGLDDVVTVGGNITLETNAAMTEIAGLKNVVNVGGALMVRNNPSLERITGLTNRTFGDVVTQGVYVEDNDVLTRIGMPAIGDGPAHIVLRNNPLLSLVTMGTQAHPTTLLDGDLYVQGSGLEDLSGFDSIEQVTGEIVLTDNASLTSLTGLENIEPVIESLALSSNPALTNMSALSHITVINGDLTLSENNGLTDLPLGALASVNGDITVHNNGVLGGLYYGLVQLGLVQGAVQVTFNPVLPDCDAWNLVGRLVTNGYDEGDAIISGNNPDCTID